MLLSGAWWAQKLTGVTAQALAIAILAAAVIGSLWWLRHDARMDERAIWSGRLTAARLQQAVELRARERQAEAIAARKADEWAQQLSAAQSAQAEIEATLAAMKRNPVCWPKDLVRSLNK
jgi:hypothetical protein